MSDGACLQRL